MRDRSEGVPVGIPKEKRPDDLEASGRQGVSTAGGLAMLTVMFKASRVAATIAGG